MSKAPKAEKKGTKRAREEDGSEKESARRTRRRLNEKPPVDPVDKAKNRLRGAQGQVLKAAKAAKLFETQRLVKKLKQARIGKLKNDELSKLLEIDLAVVKDADPHELCNEALANRIRKDGALSHDERCMAALDIVIPPEQQSKKLPKEQQKGWGRLLSSKKLATGIHHVMLALKKEFGSAAKHEEMKKRQAEEREERLKAGKLSRKDKLALGMDVQKVKSAAGEAGDENEEQETDEENVDAMLEDGDEDSDEESEGEDSDAAPADKAEKELVDLPDGGSDAPVDDFEDSDNADDDDDDEKEASTFLPALNVGFVAGSDSDYDEEAEDVDGPERKNRRGQRARKAIWEKKYGKNANHIKKQREEAVATGLPPTRGDFGSGRGRGRGRGAERGGRGTGRGGYKPGPSGFDPRDARKGMRPRGATLDRGWGGRVGHAGASTRPAPAEPPSFPAPSQDKPMHPSWQAKKSEKNTGQAVAAQGKKIVFGD
ncbi:Bud-site selection protein [Calocera cornea HHB12733]|uniref:Bud-site selection protein n=1 Tax=Calocera cornea HHB12733 TaxID=1353952 RepID=A0A165IAL7_9BASI|nr:Bud-site selection protein [Calocera cornea HHB12733]